MFAWAEEVKADEVRAAMVDAFRAEGITSDAWITRIEPVGAKISVFSPAKMAGQPCRCGGVAAPNVARNQEATTGKKPSSPSPSARAIDRGEASTRCGSESGRAQPTVIVRKWTA